MCPPEGCSDLRLKLDYVGVGTKGLVIRKETFYVQAFIDKVGYCPIHNEFMSCCGLEIGLRIAKDFFKKFTKGIKIRELSSFN